MPLAIRRNYDKFLEALEGGEGDTAPATEEELKAKALEDKDKKVDPLLNDLEQQVFELTLQELENRSVDQTDKYGSLDDGSTEDDQAMRAKKAKDKAKNREEEGWGEEGEEVAYMGMEYLGQPNKADVPPFHPSEGRNTLFPSLSHTHTHIHIYTLSITHILSLIDILSLPYIHHPLTNSITPCNPPYHAL